MCVATEEVLHIVEETFSEESKCSAQQSCGLSAMRVAKIQKCFKTELYHTAETSSAAAVQCVSQLLEKSQDPYDHI